jgi:hypothetical protein
MSKSRLNRLAQQFQPPAGDGAFAPVWWSMWCEGFCSAIDEDMGRPTRWHHHKPPYRHHRAELRVWVFCTFKDFEAMRGRVPTVAEFRNWVSAARQRAAQWAGQEVWSK